MKASSIPTSMANDGAKAQPRDEAKPQNQDKSMDPSETKTPKTPKTRIAKPPKTSKVKGVPNKHLHARTTFLYKAATYLTLQAAAETEMLKTDTEIAAVQASNTQKLGDNGLSMLALQLGTHLRAVSLKGQVRLSTDLKRSICKTCNAILIPGRTSTQTVENESKRGEKLCADVLVAECSFCSSKKRFPIGATRQERKAVRTPINGYVPPQECQ